MVPKLSVTLQETTKDNSYLPICVTIEPSFALLVAREEEERGLAESLLQVEEPLICFCYHSSRILYPRHRSLLPKMMNADMDAVDAENQVELEEKTRLINQVLELQHTLEDLSARVDAVKEENLKLKSENQVLGQYIENLMSASSVFQTTDTKSKRK
uniref:Short coiled-coil protein n=1 Tax=Ovis aries TaxID=9940 RepID=A0AC11EM03_SHEEP